MRTQIAVILLFAAIPTVRFASADKPAAPAPARPPKPPEIVAGDDAFQHERWDDAVRAYQAALKKGIDNPLLHFRLGFSLHMRGRHEEALPHHLLATRIDSRPLRIDALYNVACANARLGRKEEALKALARAIEAGFVDTPQVARDSDLDSLRDDPSFQKLVASIPAAPRPDGGAR